MDHALPVPAGLDRRKLAALVLAGAGGVALAEAGLPVSAPSLDGLSSLDSFRRMTAALVSGYDTAGPVKTAAAASALEGAFADAIGRGAFTGAAADEAKAAYARLLVLGANARGDVGRHADAARTAKTAASLAVEVGEAQTAGHAWVVTSAAELAAGRPDRALEAAQRAQWAAGGTPAAAMALDAEASAAASLGRVHAVVDAVTAMEGAQDGVPGELRGTFGSYGDAHVLAFAAASLARVGLHGEARPRLVEAADVLPATDGLMVHVWLTRAGVELAGGAADVALDFAALAVASAETRPSAWAAGGVAALDRAHRRAGGGGEFEGLVATAAGWEFPAP